MSLSQHLSSLASMPFLNLRTDTSMAEQVDQECQAMQLADGLLGTGAGRRCSAAGSAADAAGAGDSLAQQQAVHRERPSEGSVGNRSNPNQICCCLAICSTHCQQGHSGFAGEIGNGG